MAFVFEEINNEEDLSFLNSLDIKDWTGRHAHKFILESGYYIDRKKMRF